MSVDLTIFALDCSVILKRGEEEDVSEGAEEGECIGDFGKLGEAGKEWLLTCMFVIWISRQSPLTDTEKIIIIIQLKKKLTKTYIEM